jgi:polyhydroxyalkanoate synthesis repressor PhaR
MTAAPIQIRRYPNRRFYDRSRRQYVTLGDIEELVREGRTIEVQDSRTGEDLTRQVLAQILLERHPDKMELFPAALLHGLLRANDLATDFWQAYLRQAMLTLENLQRAVVPMGSPMSWFSAIMPGMASMTGIPGISGIGSNPGLPTSDELASRLEELEERIIKLEGGAGASEAADSASSSESTLDRLERRIGGLEKRARGS